MKFKNKNTKLFLVIGASTLALGSIGFASWIIGVQQKEATSNLNVTVDTASLSNIKVDYEMSNRNVDIKETTEQSDPNALIKPTEVNPDALKFSFESITVKVGSGVAEQDRPTKLKVSLPTDINAANIVSDKNFNKIEVKDKEASKKYREDKAEGNNDFTYLEYSKEITLDYNSTSVKDDYYTFTFTTEFANQQFTLGTYFDYVGGNPAGANPTTSVSEFYNTIYKDYEGDDFLMAQAVNVKAELDQMHTALNKNNALTLKIELLNQ